MILRRYYRKGIKYAYYYKPHIQSYHELLQYAKDHPQSPVMDYDNAEYEYILSSEEQDSFWLQGIKLVMTRTRWVLDNLDDIPEFKVRWNYYGSKNSKRSDTIGMPPAHVTAIADKLYNHI